MDVRYLIKSFEDLSNIELYKILKLRNEVFIVEQNCVYQDIDNKDLSNYHLMCLVNNELAGYTRLLAPGISYADASIGRVVIGQGFRSLGLGKKIMEQSIANSKKLYNNAPIRISAQYHLSKFYNSLGFEEIGQPYDEDGIPHIEMLRV